MNTPMHRFKYTKLNREQIASKLVQAASGPKCLSGLSDVFVGKSLKIVTDDGATALETKTDLLFPKMAEQRLKQDMAHCR
jgi:hypothetical protein